MATTEAPTEIQAPATKQTPDEVKQALRARRNIACVSPSGVPVVVRPINLERHALAGGLPARLKAIAAGGVNAVDEAIKATAEGDFDTLEYLDSLVCMVLVEPEMMPPKYARADGNGKKEGDLVEGDALDDYLLPADYRWLLLIAYGEEDRDGEGRRLWGVEPLTRWATFRAKHGCAPDCEACLDAQGELSVPSAGF